MTAGPAGPKGDRGKSGPRLPSGIARAVVILFLVGVAIGAANLIFTAHYVNDQRAAQERQGQMIEQKLCATLDGLTALKPPAGNPATNPSRAYLQAEHARLAQLGADLGCPP